jgi:hypothetical protein
VLLEALEVVEVSALEFDGRSEGSLCLL